MKYKIRKEIEEIIDLEFPLFYDYAGVVKILSPESYINARVSNGDFNISKYKDMPGCVENIILHGTPITKEEFNVGYRKALDHAVHEAFMQASESEGAAYQVYERNEELHNAVNLML